MNNKIQNLQAFFEEWKTQFDNPPAFDCPFRIEADGMLYAGETPLCPADDIDLKDSEFSVESLHLSAKHETYFLIEIHWPAAGPVKISYIGKTQQLFPATA